MAYKYQLKSSSRKIFQYLFLPFFLISYSSFSQVVFVDQNAPCVGVACDGLNWNSAYKTLEEALQNPILSIAGGEVWVADGIYKPTNGSDRTKSFIIPDDVRVIGHFKGGEISPNDRNLNDSSYKTILSGDIGMANDPSDNSYHVVTIPGNGTFTALDGLHITEGFANGGGTNQKFGGGVLLLDGYLKIVQCHFVKNYAEIKGGGIYSKDAVPKITSSRFVGNKSDDNGGAIHVTQTMGETVEIINSIFIGNMAENGSGGGVYASSFSTVYVVNSDLLFNKADKGGALTNASGNSMEVYNSIFYGNNGNLNPLEELISGSITSQKNLRDVSCTVGCSFNIYSSTPQFVRMPSEGTDGIWGTPDDDLGDLRLLFCSPAVDNGDNSRISLSKDIEGKDRFQDVIQNSNTGFGTSPYVDIGAYESRSNSNFAPTIDLSQKPELEPITRDIPDSINDGTYIWDLVDGVIFDLEDACVGESNGMAIVDIENSNGIWEYTLDGTNWNTIINPSNTNALLLNTNGSTKIRFIPNPGFSGDLEQAFTYHGWDQSDGKPSGSYSDISASNEFGAYSQEKISATLLIRNPIAITKLNPYFGYIGDEISIEGIGFGSNPDSIAVTFGTISAKIISVSENQVKVEIPKHAPSLAPVYVSNFSSEELGSTIKSETPLFQTIFYNGKISNDSYNLKDIGSTLEKPSDLATGDFNGDGQIDLVSSHPNKDEIRIAFSNQSEFTNYYTINIADQPDKLDVADMDFDGILDIIVACRNNNQIGILYGKGDGYFESPTFLNTGNNPSSLLAVDLINNGYPDIVFTNQNDNTVELYINEGNRTYDYDGGSLIGDIPVEVISADFDKDGNPDVAIANSGSNDIGIILVNPGDEAEFYNFSTGLAPSAIDFADFNLDGNIDLATSNYSGNNISILLGNGDGTFANAISVIGGQIDKPSDIETADYNGDGIPDIATTSAGKNLVNIFLGDGSGNFPEFYEFPVGQQPVSLKAINVDRGGETDILVANENSNSISLLAYSPIPTKNLKMWLAADLGVSKDGNGKISSWNDWSNNGNNAGQLTPANQPVLEDNQINGLPTIKFNGSNQFLNFNADYLIDSDYAFFVVEARNSNKNNNFFIGGNDNSQNKGIMAGYYNENMISLGSFEDNLGNYLTDYNIPEYGITHFEFSTDSGRYLTWNAALMAFSFDSTGISSYDSPFIGRSLNQYYEGNIAEIIIYNKWLSESEREDIFIYLQQKYNIYQNGSEVSNPPTNLIFDEVTDINVNASFTPSIDAPDGYLVLRHNGVRVAPIDTEPLAYGNIYEDQQVVYIGPSTSFEDSLNIEPLTKYYYDIYPYNEYGLGINYGENFLSDSIVTSKEIYRGINIADSLALASLYDSIGNKLLWDKNSPVIEWEGVGITDKRVTSLDLSYKGLYFIPTEPLQQLEELDSLNIIYNKLSFSLINDYKNLVDSIWYNPQLNLDEAQNIYAYEGENLILNISKIKQSGKDLLQWQLNGQDISGSTSDTLMLANVDGNTEGKYQCIFTHPDYPNMKLASGYRYVNVVEEVFYDDSIALKTVYDQFTEIDPDLPVEAWPGVKVENKRVVEVNLPSKGLSGTIPVAFGNLSELKRLDLFNNNLTGTIPEELGQLKELTYLDLDKNNLIGKVPEALTQLTKLRTLWISRNFFTALPDSISKWEELENFYVHSNKIDSVPAQLSFLSALKELTFGKNNLSNFIQNFDSLNNLEYLDISENKISVLNTGIEKLINLQKLDLSDNEVIQIEFSPDNLPALAELNLRRNRLSFKDLENLDYSGSTYQLDYSPQKLDTNITDTLLLIDSDFTIFSTAEGDNNIYQWQKNGVDIPGENQSFLNLNAIAIADRGIYSCRITNSMVPNLVINDDITRLQVNCGEQLATITTAFETSICKGSNIYVELVSTADTTLSYQWYKNGQAIGLATSHEYIAYEPGNYVLTVTQESGCSSRSNKISIVEKPTANLNLVHLDSTTLLAKSNQTGQFKWYLDGEELEGVNDSILSIPQSGNYKAGFINQYGCETQTEEASFVITGLENNHYSKEIIIYPNPTKGIVEIDFGNVFTGKIQINIFNTQGDLFQSKELTNDAKTQLDLSGLPTGLYLIEIVSNQGRALKKINKN
ncbi:FG-GAP-like repeat-containing protein [Flexithrix dorotheae]|uniref:FG-GAP-like repeat-containing protein n=1 Tax=Flexithrix dorotheae TaxID=70993 RepID=UPI000379A84C|nr:FG-GAP-like repeat-containing protein [Flexithrix dorotheae]